ncbi:MAG: oligopeptide transporter, OPT family [Bacteroidales bacterium]|nr:oligopeptide transporter, OPT family [Lentimicrobiaceae bacterium]MDD5695353.1 oligopeptide transporter, OPT family [Bacteroidales bacterium]
MSEQRKYVPFVSAETNLKEFTIRALVIGLILAVILGAANAYLGLKAGMTIAATYPAAVIGMALIKAMRGTILEENFTRTVGSIGESVAAGAIFTIPAFYIVYLDSQRQGVVAENFFTYGTTTIILIVGGVLGIMFVALLRRVMVEDTELVFPESIAAAEIHKSGQKASRGSSYLFTAMGIGGLIKALGEFKLFSTYWEKFYTFSKQLITGTNFSGQGGMMMASPGIAPAYLGVGYIIGPRLAALNFSGTLIAWGLLTPMILYFLAPGFDIQGIASGLMAADPSLSGAAALDKAWVDTTYKVWRFIVRPIAIGGMLVSAVFTLYRMRASLGAGLKRSVGDVRKAAKGIELNVPRTEKDLRFNWIILGILAVAIVTFLVTKFVFHANFLVAIVAATVLIILAFFFAAVSGYLVGIMGSSNNPISGLTLTALVVTALIMVLLGVHGQEGVATTLGVAAIVCVGAAVAGEMLQDLKAGHILGGTPWRMQVGDILGVVVAGSVMFFVLRFLNDGDIAKGAVEGYEGGFGSTKLSAPQANLMALLSQGIVGGNMAWPLIIAGMVMGFAFILAQVKSPMLVCVGMYLPLETTFAIFIGGIIKGIVDYFTQKRGFTAGQLTTVENTGILLASGLIAGEALVGLIFAIFAVGNMFPPAIFARPSYLVGIVILIIIGYILVNVPLRVAKKSV